jgi:hypothetical protein
VPTPFGRVAVLGLGDRFRHGYTAGPAAPGTTPITAETIAAGRAGGGGAVGDRIFPCASTLC